VSRDALREVNPAVNDSVWAGKRLLPRGYELRVPRDPMRAAPRVVLASIGASERIDSQVADSSGTHRVRRGETLSRIAAKYGVSTRELQRANGLRSANNIRVGQRLKIPGSEPPPLAEPAPSSSPAMAQIAQSAPEPTPAEGVYRVQRGDTLASIARKFGVSARDLAVINRIQNANQIHPGQVIELPGGSLTARPEDRSHAGTYTVRRGDTLDEIARKFGVGVAELSAHNGIANKHRIKVGQSIYIPGPPEPPAQTPPVAPAGAPAPSEASAPPTAVAEASPPAQAEAVASAAAAAAAAEYVVRRGDSLERIAALTGVTQRELIELNGIRNKHRIEAGQKLKLPAPPPPAPPAETPQSTSEPAAAPNPPAASAGAAVP
jgi:LysM repeat protein